jgi:hypothetical protein
MDAGRSGSRFESMYIKEKINSCATVKPDGKLNIKKPITFTKCKNKIKYIIIIINSAYRRLSRNDFSVRDNVE